MSDFIFIWWRTSNTTATFIFHHVSSITTRFANNDTPLNNISKISTNYDNELWEVSQIDIFHEYFSWWRHQMETFSALPAICAGNSPVTGEFLAQRPVTRSFDVFFDLGLNERLSKQSCGMWFETLSRPLWRHSNGSDFFFSQELTAVVQEVRGSAIIVGAQIMHGSGTDLIRHPVIWLLWN